MAAGARLFPVKVSAHLSRALPRLALFASVAACAAIAGVETDAPKVAEGVAPPTPPPPPDTDGVRSSEAFEIEPKGEDGLVFGGVNCGDKGVQAVLVKNLKDTPLPFSASLPEGTSAKLVDGPNDVTELQGTIAPKSVKSLTVRVAPTTAGDEVIPLAVTVDTALARIPIRLTGLGAVLRVTPSVADFGQVRYQTGGSIPVQVTNTGNAHATITGISTLNTADDGFDVTPKTADLAPNAPGITLTASLAPSGAASAKKTREVTLVTSTPVCEAAAKLKLEGERITTDITVSPATLDWGRKGCGEGTDTRAITIENFDQQQAASWSVTLSPTTRFEVAGGVTSGSIPAVNGGGPQRVSVQFKPKVYGTPLGRHTEDATVTVTGRTGPSPRTVRLAFDVRGVIYEVTPKLMDTFSRRVGEPAQVRSARIVNRGNEPASPKYNIVQITGNGFSVEPDDLTLYPNFYDDIDVSFVAPQAGDYEAKITTERKYPATTWPLCNADELVVKGVGTPAQ